MWDYIDRASLKWEFEERAKLALAREEVAAVPECVIELRAAATPEVQTRRSSWAKLAATVQGEAAAAPQQKRHNRASGTT